MSSSAQRRPGTADAVVLGMAAMLGTGVFAVWTPAAAAAGPWLLAAVVLAGVVAVCNAASIADLTVAHPESTGGYGCGYDRLSVGVGRLAGVAFLTGTTAAAAAAAGVFGGYVLPAQPLVAATMVIVAATVLNTAGVRSTARGAYALVGGTLAVLLVVVLLGLFGSDGPPVASVATPDAEPMPERGGVLGVLTAAGLVFFAFVGYARVAAPRRQVGDRNLRRAFALALGITLVTYLLVAGGLLAGLGTERLATEPTPLVAVVDAGQQTSAVGVLVRVGAAVATGAALLSMLVAMSRTAAAMAQRNELPACLAAIGSRGTPGRADLVGGVVALVVAVLAGPTAAMALSACALLVHSALIHLAALRLPSAARRLPAWTAVLGLVLCVGLAVLLPPRQVVTTVVAVVIGWVVCTVLARRGSPTARQSFGDAR